VEILREIDEIRGYRGLVFPSAGDFLWSTVGWPLNLVILGDLEEWRSRCVQG
jgi:hypothetical protein